MTTKSKYFTVDDIIALGKVEKHIYGEVKRTLLNFETVTVCIVGSDHDIIYGNFVDSFEIAIIDNKSGNFVTKLFLGGEDVVAWASREELQNIVNIFTGAPSPKTRVVERLTTS